MAKEEKKCTWEVYTAEEFNELEVLNAGYREFLDQGKTES